MRVETVRFGVLDVEESQIFNFPIGMLGFAKYKLYIVLDHSENSPFKWLQSIDDETLALSLRTRSFSRPIIILN